MAVIGSLSVKLGLVTVEWDKATDHAKAQAKALQAEFDRLGGKLKSIGEHFKNIASASVAVGFAALYQNAKSLTDEVSDLSSSYGLTTSEILLFRDALQSSGGQADSASKVLSTLFSKIDDAKQGTDSAIAKFDKLGITFSDLKRLSPYEAIQRVAAGFGNISDQFEKTKTIKDFFGKAGIGLTMDVMAAALQKSTSAFDEYSAAIKTVGEISDATKANLANLTIAFAAVIEPIVGTKILTVKEFEKILRGLGSAALVLGIGAVAAQIVKIGAAIRAATAAGAAFNLMAGGATPVGIILKAVSVVGGIGAFMYMSSDAPTRGGGDDGGKSKVPAYDKKMAAEAAAKAEAAGTSPVSNETQNKRTAIGLAKTLLALEGQRNAILLDITGKDALSNDLALIEIGRKEKLATINSKLAQDLKSMEDTATKAAKDATSGLAAQDRARVEQDAKQQTAMAKEKDRLAQKKTALEEEEKLILAQYGHLSDNEDITAKEAADIGLAADQLALSLGLQVREEGRLAKLANDRLGYENQLAFVSSDTKASLMAQFDLEAKIVDFKRQANALGVPVDQIELYAAALRKAGRETIALQDQTTAMQQTFGYGWNDAFRQFNDNLNNSAQMGRDSFNAFTNNMSSALDNFVRTGKLSFKDLVGSIMRDLVAIQLKASATGLFSMLVKGITAYATGGTSLVADAVSPYALGSARFGEPRANGGPVSSGVAHLVGERGPELFVPNGAGSIVSNGKFGGTTNVTNNYINAIDTKSFEQRLLGSSNAVWAANMYANKSLAIGKGRS
jgi:lambda family phage tail tape measure protein